MKVGIKKTFVSGLFLALAVLVFTECRREDEVPFSCSNGYELTPEGDSCYCPPDMYDALGVCKFLQHKEYYGIAKGCACEDTLFLQIDGEGSLNVLLYPNENFYHAWLSIMQYGGAYKSYRVKFFYGLTGQDSISGELTDRYCYVNGKQLRQEIRFRRLNPRLLRTHLLYFDEQNVRVDSCTFFLER